MPEWVWGLAKLLAAAALGAAFMLLKAYLATHPLQPRHDRHGQRRPGQTGRPRRHLRRVS